MEGETLFATFPKKERVIIIMLKEYPFLKAVLRAIKVLIALSAAAAFGFGVIDRSQLITIAPGYDGVFTVVGGIVLFFFLFPLYSAARNFFSMPPQRYIEWSVRLVFLAIFAVQCGLLVAYLIFLNSDWRYVFLLIPDLVLFGVMLKTTAYTSIWATVYTLSVVAKLAILFGKLNDPQFLSQDNPLGQNGLTVILLLTIAVVQFPVTLSRLMEGMDIYEAYTANMAAVFAHTLHLLDCVSLYINLGIDQAVFPTAVQQLLLMLCLMGVACINVYYILLFFVSSSDSVIDGAGGTTGSGSGVGNAGIAGAAAGMPLSSKGIVTGAGMLRGGASGPGGDAGAPGGMGAGGDNEDLLHYVMWCVFFVDLPYFVVRVMAWFLHDVSLSPFVAKNIMMATSAALMVMRHARGSQGS